MATNGSIWFTQCTRCKKTFMFDLIKDTHICYPCRTITRFCRKYCNESCDALPDCKRCEKGCPKCCHRFTNCDGE